MPYRNGRASPVIDLSQVRGEIDRIIGMLERALAAEGVENHRPEPKVIAFAAGNQVVRIKLLNIDPFSYQREARTFYKEQGLPFPDFLPADPTAPE